MFKCLKQQLPLVRAAGVISFLVLSIRAVQGQSAPVSSDRPWHTSIEFKMEADASNISDSRFSVDPAKTYSLPELIDLAEAHNPATRVSWERARAQAASLGIARSELYPTLAVAALSQTARQEAFFGSRFYGQVVQDFEVEADLNYTLFDFGARPGRINAARAQLLAANVAFNDTHRRVIYQVQQAYYRLLSSMGEEESARASLSNAEAVQQAAEQRLANGLATRPDVLEARSATAQAEYDLQAILGAEEIARGDLATAIGSSATAVIQVEPLDPQGPTPESIGDTVDQAINRALGQRPDLLQQVAEIRAAAARVKEKRAAYYPALSLNVSSSIPSLYGLQSFPWAHTADLVGSVRFNLSWTVFDGGARNNRVAEARAEVHAAEAQANVKRNQIADEVWAAYSKLNTAFRQRQAATALLESASQSYSAALESYNSGVRNLLDVTAAQRTLAQARTADVLARTQVLASFSELAFRTGDSIRTNASPRP